MLFFSSKLRNLWTIKAAFHLKVSYADHKLQFLKKGFDLLSFLHKLSVSVFNTACNGGLKLIFRSVAVIPMA